MLWAAALTFGGCWVGARAGTAVTFPGLGAAVLFPPYAVLAAALILTPLREWWLYVLAAAAGNFGPHFQHEGLRSFVLLTEVANSVRALVAALGVRCLAGEPAARLFDNLRATIVFMVFAVFLGPAVGALLGASAVMLRDGAASFTVVWQAWLLSNVLTGATLLPLLLMICTRTLGGRPFHRRAPGRVIEAIILAAAVLAVGAHVFAGAPARGVVPARLYWPLPLLLWAAVRFRPSGTIVALSVVTALSIVGAASGRGPFVGGATAVENLVQLQYFLIAFCVPLLLLAVLVRQETQTAAALRESRAEYRAVVEDQTELICRSLPDGTYTFVNGAYCRYFQRTPEQLLDRTFWEFIPPQAHAAGRAHLASITPECPVGTIEHEVVAPGGERRWQQWTNRGFFDERGRIIGYQSVGRDVTERRQAAREHEQLEAQKQVAAALRDSKAKVDEANRAKDRFLAALSHELRTPLTPVLLAAQAHMHDLDLPADLRWDLQVIYTSAAMEAALIDDLLDLTRVDRGKIELKCASLDIHELLGQTVRTCCDDMFRRKSLRFALELGATRTRVMGDAIRLSQTAWNIIKNAIKFSEPGAVITIRTADIGEWSMAIEFIDTGYGIEPEELSRIFDAFEQGGSDVTRRFGGLGLGLTLCKTFVDLHGGRISAFSRGRGTGATFRVELPATQAVAPAAAQGRVTPAPNLDGNGEHLPGDDSAMAPTAGVRILLVEDHEFTARLLARLLRGSGHEVHVADGVASALAIAARSPLDLVISDLGLPDGTGLELMAELIRKHRLPGIALSGYGMGEDLQRSRAAGFVEHLVKPVSIDMVQEAIARAMASHQRLPPAKATC